MSTADEAALAVARFGKRNGKAPTSPSQPVAPPQDRKRSASPTPIPVRSSKRSK